MTCCVAVAPGAATDCRTCIAAGDFPLFAELLRPHCLSCIYYALVCSCIHIRSNLKPHACAPPGSRAAPQRRAAAAASVASAGRSVLTSAGSSSIALRHCLDHGNALTSPHSAPIAATSPLQPANAAQGRRCIRRGSHTKTRHREQLQLHERERRRVSSQTAHHNFQEESSSKSAVQQAPACCSSARRNRKRWRRSATAFSTRQYAHTTRSGGCASQRIARATSALTGAARSSHRSHDANATRCVSICVFDATHARSRSVTPPSNATPTPHRPLIFLQRGKDPVRACLDRSLTADWISLTRWALLGRLAFDFGSQAVAGAASTVSLDGDAWLRPSACGW